MRVGVCVCTCVCARAHRHADAGGARLSHGVVGTLPADPASETAGTVEFGRRQKEKKENRAQPVARESRATEQRSPGKWLDDDHDDDDDDC